MHLGAGSADLRFARGAEGGWSSRARRGRRSCFRIGKIVDVDSDDAYVKESFLFERMTYGRMLRGLLTGSGSRFVLHFMRVEWPPVVPMMRPSLRILVKLEIWISKTLTYLKEGSSTINR